MTAHRSGVVGIAAQRSGMSWRGTSIGGRRLGRVFALSVAVSVVASCTSHTAEQRVRPIAPSAPGAGVDYARTVGSPVAQSSWIGIPTDASDLLPNRLIAAGEHRSVRYVQSVVVADVVAVEPERAAVWSGLQGDDEEPQTVPFDSDEAETRTWIVQLSVRDTIAGPAPTELVEEVAGTSVQVRYVTGGGPVDIARFGREMRSLDGTIWFLKTRDGWTDALDVAWFGRAIGLVDGAGRITFPLLDGDTLVFRVPKDLTVDRIRELAAEPDSTIGDP